MQRATPSGPRSIFTPSCSSTSAEAAQRRSGAISHAWRPSPRSRPPRSPRGWRCERRQSITAGPACVEERGIDLDRVANARAVRAKPVISSTVSPFIPQGDHEAAIWTGWRHAHDRLERGGSLLLRSASRSDELRYRFDHAGTLAARLMKCLGSSALFREHRLRVELDA